MNVTIQIPDQLARELAAAGGDQSRRALALAPKLPRLKVARL